MDAYTSYRSKFICGKRWLGELIMWFDYSITGYKSDVLIMQFSFLADIMQGPKDHHCESDVPAW